MDNSIIGLLVFIGCIILGRVINERAIIHLDVNQKADLIDLFSKRRLASYGILIVIIIIYAVMMKTGIIDRDLAYALYMIFLVLFVIFLNLRYYSILKRNNFPLPYIKAFLLSTSLRLLGIIILLILLRTPSIF